MESGRHSHNGHAKDILLHKKNKAEEDQKENEDKDDEEDHEHEHEHDGLELFGLCSLFLATFTVLHWLISSIKGTLPPGAE